MAACREAEGVDLGATFDLLSSLQLACTWLYRTHPSLHLVRQDGLQPHHSSPHASGITCSRPRADDSRRSSACDSFSFSSSSSFSFCCYPPARWPCSAPASNLPHRFSRNARPRSTTHAVRITDRVLVGRAVATSGRWRLNMVGYCTCDALDSLPDKRQKHRRRRRRRRRRHRHCSTNLRPERAQRARLSHEARNPFTACVRRRCILFSQAAQPFFSPSLLNSAPL